MDKYTSRFTSKDADLYGADIFKGLNKLLNRTSLINPTFEEEIRKLTEAIYENRNNLNWGDLDILQELANKIYKTK